MELIPEACTTGKRKQNKIEKINHTHLEKENALRNEFEEQKKAMTRQRMESFDAIQSKFQNQVYENNQIFQSKIESLTKVYLISCGTNLKKK